MQKDEPENLIELPPIVHWYVHKLLNEAFIELGMNEYANKLSGCCDGIAQFINKGKARTEQIDFSKEQAIIEFLDNTLNLAIDITGLVVKEFSYKSAMPDILDIQIDEFERNSKKIKEQLYLNQQQELDIASI